MLRPYAQGIAQIRETSGSRRILAFAAAGVIELTLIAALTSGLAQRAIKELPHVLTMVDITPQVQQPQNIPPAAPPKLVQPTVPDVPAPIIRIQRTTPPKTITAVATPEPVVTVPVVTDTTPVAPQPIAPTGALGVSGTHTIPPYPELARRLNQQGQVQLHIVLAADGRITGVSVAKSSGSDLLDSAARDWVMANWKYKPATENGVAIASTTDALVVFDIKSAR